MGLEVLLYKLNSVADECIPPISLGYLAACSPGHDLHVLDGQRLQLKDADVVTYCLTHNIKVFGLSAMTKDLPASRRLLRRVKDSVPGITTVVGGTQAWLMPKETLDFYGDSVDCVFSGESERSFPAFLDSSSEEVKWNKRRSQGLFSGQEMGIQLLSLPAALKILMKFRFPAGSSCLPTRTPTLHMADFSGNTL